MTCSTGPSTAWPAGEVDDAVQVRQQRVHVVRDEQHRDAGSAADAGRRARRPRPGWAGRGCRAARRAGAAGAARRAPGRSAGAAAPRPSTRRSAGPRRSPRRPSRSPQRRGCAPWPRRAAASRPMRQRQPPAIAVEAQPDDVAAAQARARARTRGAGAGSRSPAGLPRRAAEHASPHPRSARSAPSSDLQQRRLARAVRAEQRDELAPLDPHGDIAPDRAPADPHAASRSSTAGWPGLASTPKIIRLSLVLSGACRGAPGSRGPQRLDADRLARRAGERSAERHRRTTRAASVLTEAAAPDQQEDDAGRGSGSRRSRSRCSGGCVWRTFSSCACRAAG